MKDQFVTYKIALKLKELGFDEPCLAWYNPNGVFIWNICCVDEDNDYTCSTKDMFKTDIHPDGYLAPLWQQLIDWLREKRDIHLYLPKSVYGGYIYVVDAKYSDTIYANFYDAREQVILKAIELCKKNN